MYPTQYKISPRMSPGNIIYEIKEGDERLCFCNDGNARYKIDFKVQRKRPMTEEEIKKAREIADEKLKIRDAELRELEKSIKETHERFVNGRSYH